MAVFTRSNGVSTGREAKVFLGERQCGVIKGKKRGTDDYEFIANEYGLSIGLRGFKVRTLGYLTPTLMNMHNDRPLHPTVTITAVTRHNSFKPRFYMQHGMWFCKAGQFVGAGDTWRDAFADFCRETEPTA